VIFIELAAVPQQLAGAIEAKPPTRRDEDTPVAWSIARDAALILFKRFQTLSELILRRGCGR
jgi:hypothetical protein